MSFLISLLQKLRGLILGIVRVIGKAICCRKRRHESEMLLPLTIPQTSQVIKTNEEVFHNWDDWEGDKQVTSHSDAVMINVDHKNSTTADSHVSDEDFFKDMVPQLRKPKKVIVNAGDDLSHRSNRLSMDPSIFSSTGPDLGLLEESPSNWEVCEDEDELWDPDSLIKEKKLAEREQRIADHQRRKQEKEANRTKKSIAATNNVYQSESKDKTKYS